MKSMWLSLMVLGTVAVGILMAQGPMRPGRWERTSQMQMPGMQMPEMKTTQCVTPEQLKDPSSALPDPSSAPGDKQACKLSDYKASGNTVTWKMACSGAQAMTGNGEMTFAGDAYTGTIKMSMQQGEVTMKLAGKRVGDCTP